MQTSLKFLGVGSAIPSDLGNSCAVVLINSRPSLMIDCGFDSLNRYKQSFGGELPSSVFITHCHFDHIGGLEQLYFQAALSGKRPIIYIHVSLIEMISNILSNAGLAEGGAELWDVFDVRPVTKSFVCEGHSFFCHAVNHHAPGTAYSLHLPGYFFYSGDTRPIPELINHTVGKQEVIFHDCCLNGNPSHTGLDDILSTYSESVRERMWLYHYHCASDVKEFGLHGLNAVTPYQQVDLTNHNGHPVKREVTPKLPRSA